MKRKRHYGSTDQVDVNISPLIDMMFLLLIFFIVTTTFVEEVGVEIKKPKASMSESLSKKSIMLALSKEGKIFYAGREIGINGVRGLISRLIQKDDRPVIVLADADSTSSMLVEVIDECKAGGSSNVSVATEKK